MSENNSSKLSKSEKNMLDMSLWFAVLLDRYGYRKCPMYSTFSAKVDGHEVMMHFDGFYGSPLELGNDNEHLESAKRNLYVKAIGMALHEEFGYEGEFEGDDFYNDT